MFYVFVLVLAVFGKFYYMTIKSLPFFDIWEIFYYIPFGNILLMANGKTNNAIGNEKISKYRWFLYLIKIMNEPQQKC